MRAGRHQAEFSFKGGSNGMMYAVVVGIVPEGGVNSGGKAVLILDVDNGTSRLHSATELRSVMRLF